jgi:hypothetical protein
MLSVERGLAPTREEQSSTLFAECKDIVMKRTIVVVAGYQSEMSIPSAFCVSHGHCDDPESHARRTLVGSQAQTSHSRSNKRRYEIDVEFWPSN